MLKFGRISDINKGLVRVAFQSDGIVSTWLPFIVQQSNGSKSIWTPEVNSYVACLMDEHCENGVVLGCCYTNKDEAPIIGDGEYAVLFSDGGEWRYKNGEFHIKKGSNGKIILNDGSKGEMLLLDAVFDRLRALEDKLNNFITVKYNLHTHTDPATGITGIPSLTDVAMDVTVKNDLKKQRHSAMNSITSSWWSLSNKFGEIVKDKDDINQCINLILTTTKGSVPFDPEFGCGIHTMVDRSVSRVGEMIKHIADAIYAYEPRVIINKFTYSFAKNEEGQYVVRFGINYGIGVEFKKNIPAYQVIPPSSGGGTSNSEGFDYTFDFNLA